MSLEQSKNVTAHTQKVRKELKHIDVLSSWGFHYLQQMNVQVSAKECCLNTPLRNPLEIEN